MFKNINIFRSIIAVLILFIPLYPKFPLGNVTGTYVAIRIDDIVIAIAVVFWLAHQLIKKFPVFKLKITKLFLVYFMAIIASFVTAFLIYQNEPTNILLLHLVRRFEYMSVFFIAINSIKSISDFKLSYIFLLISTFFVSVYGYGQKYFQFPVVSTMNSEFSKGQLLQISVWTRINSTFAGHYDLAAFLSVALIIIAVVFILNKNKLVKAISLFVLITTYPILTFTASRVSIFAFLGGICLTLFALKKYLWVIPFIILVGFSIVNSKDLNKRLLATIPAFKSQINNTNSSDTISPTPAPTVIVTPKPKNSIVQKPTPTITRHLPPKTYPDVDTDAGVARSGEIRFNVEWPRAINAYKKNIITGSGLGSITLATDNDYLRLLGESGLLGFVSFMAINLFFIIKTIPLIFKKNQTKNNQYTIIFWGGLITMLANAIFIDVFEASKTAYLFWIMMGLYYQSIQLNEKN